MGTRSTTLFIEKGKDEKTGKVTLKKLMKFYRQFDGYPEGHGLELAEFLNSGELVNGYSMDEKLQFNGIGCLAAQVIAKLKDGVGNIYIVPLSDGGEQYDYVITVEPKYFGNKREVVNPIVIQCKEGRKLLFKGTPAEFIAKYKEEKVI